MLSAQKIRILKRKQKAIDLVTPYLEYYGPFWTPHLRRRGSSKRIQ